MFTINDFTKFKLVGRKITMVSTYDYFSAKLVEEAGIDIILVGDTLGITFAGNVNTLNVSIDNMIYHTNAVKKGAPNTFIIADMPYLSYHIAPNETVRNAGRIIQESNANAVKVEINNLSTFSHIKALIEAQIPVVGHIGLTPQSVNLFGGYKIQGTTKEVADKIINFANQLVEVGVIAIVLECIPAELSKIITEQISIATIGIGAGNSCDGQVLLFYDLLGFDPNNKFKFVKQYADAHSYLVDGLKKFSAEVVNGQFPDTLHTYR